MSDDDDYAVEDLLWCSSLFASLADGGVWGVPRSGLIFRRSGNVLRLHERMRHDPAMEISAELWRSQQDEDFDAIRRRFHAAGILVFDEGE